MRNEYEMTDADKAELAAIITDAADVKLRRKRFFAKIRQRAWRKRMKRSTGGSYE